MDTGGENLKTNCSVPFVEKFI